LSQAGIYDFGTLEIKTMAKLILSGCSPEAPPCSTSVLHRKIDSTPILISKASGNYIYTEGGHKILDGCGGAAVISIGHCDERVIKALNEQVRPAEV
jgi:4-aminobutyrate aminotransferase-like enzyme